MTVITKSKFFVSQKLLLSLNQQLKPLHQTSVVCGILVGGGEVVAAVLLAVSDVFGSGAAVAVNWKGVNGSSGGSAGSYNGCGADASGICGEGCDG